MKPAGPETAGYFGFVAELKARILAARTTAARAVNHELVLLYWDIGRAIVEKQAEHRWGDSVVERLARDLQQAIPEATGFSSRNLRSIRQFYSAYSDPSIWLQPVAKFPALKGTGDVWLQPVAKLGSGGGQAQFLPPLVAEIPWGHHLLILNKLTESPARLYYLRATARFGWTRNVLLNQIKGCAYEHSLKEGKCHNFPATLPEHLAEQAEEALKSHYNLEFALKTKANPIGVAEYQLQSKLPAEFKGKLPTARQLTDAVRSMLPAAQQR